VDSEHGNVLKEYAAMGSPRDPTLLQIEQLNKKTALPAPEMPRLQNGTLDVQLIPNALVLLTIGP
jgi:xylan 1,4-beta-xylosidase